MIWHKAIYSKGNSNYIRFQNLIQYKFERNAAMTLALAKPFNGYTNQEFQKEKVLYHQ